MRMVQELIDELRKAEDSVAWYDELSAEEQKLLDETIERTMMWLNTSFIPALQKMFDGVGKVIAPVAAKITAWYEALPDEVKHEIEEA